MITLLHMKNITVRLPDKLCMAPMIQTFDFKQLMQSSIFALGKPLLFVTLLPMPMTAPGHLWVCTLNLLIYVHSRTESSLSASLSFPLSIFFMPTIHRDATPGKNIGN